MNPESTLHAGNRLSDMFTRWMLTAVAVWASTMIHGVYYDDGISLLVAAMILGILNTLVKPILVMVALPLVLMTLGFMMFVINAILLILTSKLVPGFHVEGFWPALGASLIISVVSLILGGNRRGSRHRTRNPPTKPTYSEPVRTRTPPPGKGPIIDV
ncbi:MAG: phage holin family protein [bacterium]